MGSTLEAVRLQRHVLLSSSSSSSDDARSYSWSVISTVGVFLISLFSLAIQSTLPTTTTSSRLHDSNGSNIHRRMIFVGSKAELTIILLSNCLSLVSVIECTAPANGLAINTDGGIGFGNLYYSTWITFAISLWLLASYVRTERGIDALVELSNKGRRFRAWVGVVASSVIVMGSAASCYDARCLLQLQYYVNDGGMNNNEESYGHGSERSTMYCRRAAFGVAAGIIGCAIGISIAAIRSSYIFGNEGSKIVFIIECISGFVLLVMYSFAVAYLTGEEGPGGPLGNLYYSTWITFAMVLSITASCLEEIRAAEETLKSRDDPQWQQHQQILQQQSSRGADGISDADVSSINMTIQSVIHEEDLIPIYDRRESEETGYESSFSSSAKNGRSLKSGSVGEVQVDI